MKIKIIITTLLVVLLSTALSSDAGARGYRWHHRYGWHRDHRIFRVFRHEGVTRHRVYDLDGFRIHHRYYREDRYNRHRRHHYHHYRD